MPCDLGARAYPQPHEFRPFARDRHERRADDDDHRRPAEQPGAVGQHLTGAAQGDRHDGPAGLHRGSKRAEPERQQTGGTEERPFGKHNDRNPATKRLRDLVGTGESLRDIGFLDRDVPGAPDDRADDGKLSERGFRDEPDIFAAARPSSTITSM